MSQLDDYLARLAHGAPLWITFALALLLGLRHATDPDHLAAVTTLVASDRRNGSRAACCLGLAWGGGHALMLFALGAPAILARPYLPQAAQHTAEAAVGAVIVTLATRLLLRWRRGHFHERHPHRTRGPMGAFAIGLLHGFGGSAGAAVLLLATIASRPVAVAALAVLAAATAVSMTALSTGFGLALVRCPSRLTLNAAVPLLAGSSLAFGAWYGLTALSYLPSSL